MRLEHYISQAGEAHPTYDHLYNSTAMNERGVELAEVRGLIEALDLDGAKVLEVGNVLAHYPELDAMVPDRTIVDKYEDHPRALNVDIMEWSDEKYDLIIAISTLEHIGTDAEAPGETFPPRALHALLRLRSFLPRGGILFATWPQGHNECLDRMTSWGYFNDAAALRVWERGDEAWEIRPSDGLPRTYGATQPWAEAVTVATFGPVV